MKFPKLFEEGKLGKITTKNRIVMSPMGENMANADGSVSEQGIAYYAERAKGGAGVIIPGVLGVDYPGGKTISTQHRMDDPKYIVGWMRMAEAVHRYGALLIPQLHHAGAQTCAMSTEGMMPVCVSEEPCEHAFINVYRQMGPQRALTTEEVKGLVQKFITSAVYCKTAGCDGIELHAAHGYLISQFLSTDTNKRTDAYGGNFENRTRFAVEIVTGIRAACGPDFIIGARIAGHEWTKSGLSDAECAEVAKVLEAAGCDFFDISGGTTDLASHLMETQGYPQGDRVEYAANIKKAVSVPVFTVGNLREPAFCEKVLEDGTADYICLARALICDPYWPEKAASGRENEIRRCISCLDGCGDAVTNFRHAGCVLNPDAGYELAIPETHAKVTKAKKVLVIGSGPAGMQAAITAAERGHEVALWEKADKLGGQLNLACVAPSKAVIQWANDWLAGELERQGVAVSLNKEATVEAVAALAPDVVIAATGSLPAVPPIPGIETAIESWDLLSGKATIPEGKKVAIVGGGVVACETATLLAEKGKNQVTILEMLPAVANGLNGSHQENLYVDFARYAIAPITNALVKSVEAGKVTYTQEGETKSIDCDLVVVSTGQKSAGAELIAALKAKGYDVRTVGDAIKPGKIMGAVRGGRDMAVRI